MNNKAQIFFHTFSYKIFFYLFFATFILQILFWTKTENIKPEYNLLPNIPSPSLIRATSLGDDEFLFRIFATRIQNAGDIFAGFVSLKNYDYAKLYDWLVILDDLSPKSNFTPAMASYYFGQTQKKQDTIHIVKYLEKRADKDLNSNWWWLYQAIYLATNSLEDKDLALRLAHKLSENNATDAPLWSKQMPAFIHAEYGENCAAFQIIQNMIAENNSGSHKFSAQEMDFMRFFINTRLMKLKNDNFNPKNCKK